MDYVLMMPISDDLGRPLSLHVSVENPIGRGDAVVVGGRNYRVADVRHTLIDQDFDRSISHEQRTFLVLEEWKIPEDRA